MYRWPVHRRVGSGATTTSRLAAPDPARNLPAQVQGGLERSIVVAEEKNILDAEFERRGTLLGMADLGESLGGHCRVAAAPVAIGQDQVGHVPPFPRPPRHRPAGAELSVIGVRHHHQDPLELVAGLHQAGVGIAVETS